MRKLLYRIKNKAQKVYLKCTGRRISSFQHFNGRKIMPDDVFQQVLATKIMSGVPFVAARFGSVELRCIVEDEEYQRKGEGCFSDKTIKSMGNNAGFFPVEGDMLHRFATLMKDSSADVDFLGVWFNPLEDYIADRYAKMAEPVHLKALEPYYFDLPWSSALEGKKVLVVHPFAESIMMQYEKRNMIWGERNILPDCELKVLKAVQTAAGEKDERFGDWFEALEYMKNQIKEIDFDIAILGCGAYGFPLAAYIKSMGKQAVHLGGATQILFGIKGKRWEDSPTISSFFNDAWIRPGDKEIPALSRQVEGGCYW